MALEAGDLAAHANMAEAILDGSLERARQFRHGQGGRVVAGGSLR
jgi:hypothetical protein